MVRTTLRSTLPAAVVLCLVAILALIPIAPAQTKFQLTIDNIMRGPNLVGTEPAQVRWSGDGSKIYFQWKQAADPIGAVTCRAITIRSPR